MHRSSSAPISFCGGLPMTKNPWMKFYPADWRADPALRMCSLTARGLWIEMLAIMHEASPRGTLTINGNPIAIQQLAGLVNAPPENVQNLLAELESAGVFSRKRSGIIYSRRIERDEIKARKNRDNGKMGGSPTLCKTKEIDKSVNPPDKPRGIVTRSQKPDTRYQKEKELPTEKETLRVVSYSDTREPPPELPAFLDRREGAGR